MDDVGTVSAVEGRQSLGGMPQRLIERQGPPLQSSGQGLALDVLEDEIVDGGRRVRDLIVTDVVQRADVRVIERCDSLGFALEPIPALRIDGDVRREELEGDGSVQPGVARFVDLAHATCPERGFDEVWTERGSARERHEASSRRVEGPAPRAAITSYGPSRVPAVKVIRRRQSSKIATGSDPITRKTLQILLRDLIWRRLRRRNR